MGLYYNGKKVRNLYFNGKCITRLALGKEMTRLVEGDDFVRAKWLKGDDAYFAIPVNPYQEFLYVKFHPTSSESNHEFWSGYYNIPPNSPIEIRGMIGGSNELGIRFGIRENNVATASVIYKTGLDYLSDFSIETQYSEDNKVNYTFNGKSGIATPIIDSRANVNVSVAFRTTWCKFAKVTTDRINLTPCRLLRPIPATLDANGIARNAGECGMYNLVNGLFYGNVAASGAFTVEPSLVEGVDYERHRWLVGDGTAYIDTLVDKLKGTITVDIDRTAVTSNSNILGREAYPGLGYESRCVVNLLRQNNNYIADIYGIRTTSGYGVNIDMMDTLYLDLVAKIASTKSGNSTSIDIGTDIGGYNMLLFAKNSGSAPSYCWSGSIGEFKMADVISLTPVRLLRPLPSYLDANDKARHQFECGMLDLKTKKFYGNVNTTGNFTVSDN